MNAGPHFSTCTGLLLGKPPAPEVPRVGDGLPKALGWCQVPRAGGGAFPLVQSKSGWVRGPLCPLQVCLAICKMN